MKEFEASAGSGDEAAKRYDDGLRRDEEEPDRRPRRWCGSWRRYLLLPRASRKRGHYRWSAGWTGQGRLPFAPKTGKLPGWASRNSSRDIAVTCNFMVGVAGFEPAASSSRTSGTAGRLSVVPASPVRQWSRLLVAVRGRCCTSALYLTRLTLRLQGGLSHGSDQRLAGQRHEALTSRCPWGYPSCGSAGCLGCGPESGAVHAVREKAVRDQGQPRHQRRPWPLTHT